MTPQELKHKTGQSPSLLDKLATVGCLDELQGFADRVRADGQANARILRAIEKRRVQLSKGARR